MTHKVAVKWLKEQIIALNNDELTAERKTLILDLIERNKYHPVVVESFINFMIKIENKN